MEALNRDFSIVSICEEPSKVVARDDIIPDEEAARTGTVKTATAHIVTAVIGSGVLSLPWSISQFGWTTGPATVAVFAGVTYYTSKVLMDCYRSPDFITGERNSTYQQCVKKILGKKMGRACALTQHTSLVGCCIGYVITAGTAAGTIGQVACSRQGNLCALNTNKYLLAFGGAQLVLSQIPDLHGMWWLSILSAVMSFAYSLIGTGLSVGNIHRNNWEWRGSKFGVSLPAIDKAWGMLEALGNIAFAYSFSNCLVEIQDTLRSPPAENVSMKKATGISMGITTVFYMSLGCLGYWAFGDNAPGNLLTGFQHSDGVSFYFVEFANACIVVHLLGGYQVLAQPVFGAVEEFLSAKLLTKWNKEFKLLLRHKLMLQYTRVWTPVLRFFVSTNASCCAACTICEG